MNKEEKLSQSKSGAAMLPAEKQSSAENQPSAEKQPSSKNQLSVENQQSSENQLSAENQPSAEKQSSAENQLSAANQEAAIYQKWENSGAFKPQGNGDPYCIMLPPPNVTGSLHMGHAFQQTLMDILIRYHRMCGRKTLWQVGSDHAGIATQMVVERQLAEKNISRHSLGRETFIDEIWKWKETSGGTITRQMRRIGVSADWSRERFTMDEGLSNAVLECFVRLHEEGLIYRGKRLVNWDPALLTAVSDLEVESKEENGSLWYIRYPLENSKEYIVVATTRPETLLGDVAVAVHPEDKRYKAWIGKKVRLPLAERLIPIIADDTVLPEFGTGAVKITPAHDFNDYALGERHNLEKINIFTADAKLNEEAPKPYQGLDRFVARKRIVADLEAQDLMEKIEPYKLMVPRGDRSGAVLEPRLTDQWYVNVKSMAAAASKVVENGQVKFVPENWSKTYFEWMDNIQDWCISRQLWWGHRIPAWYDENGNVYVGRSENEIRKKHHLPPAAEFPLKQDEDVLDTWFSSALWPISTLGWPENTIELQTFYPTKVLITGFDIIFFWVARMIMFGLKFTDKIPFHDVYINAILLDHDGQKMSKTKGNVLDPLDLIDGIDLENLVKKRTTGLMQPQLAEKIEKTTRAQYPKGIPAFGTDALRFTFAALATPARYIRFDLNRIEGYRHFCNKLRNAARFVFMNTEGFALQATKPQLLADQWIVSIWQKTKEAVAQHLSQYRFDLAANAIYEFTWNEYCDWYLELSKPVLLNKENDATNTTSTNSARYTLLFILEELLRVMHPFMPYITEEIWQKIPNELRTSKDVTPSKALLDTIMLKPYPIKEDAAIAEAVENEVAWLKNFVLGVRTIRGETQISPAKTLPILLRNADQQDKERVQKHELVLRSLAKIESIAFLSIEEQAPPCATALVGTLEILIPLTNLIDKDKELARLEKELEKMDAELKKIATKLAQPNFVENAPKEVVAAEQKRQIELQTALHKLKARKQEISTLS